jgi:hypothetical protein
VGWNIVPAVARIQSRTCSSSSRSSPGAISPAVMPASGSQARVAAVRQVVDAGRDRG